MQHIQQSKYLKPAGEKIYIPHYKKTNIFWDLPFSAVKELNNYSWIGSIAFQFPEPQTSESYNNLDMTIEPKRVFLSTSITFVYPKKYYILTLEALLDKTFRAITKVTS